MVKELQALEEVMSEEAARAVHAQYNTVFSEFKLTFDSARLPGQMAISRRKWTTNSLGWRSASKRWRTCAKTHAGCWRTMMHNNNIWVLWETGSVCGNFCGRIRGNFRGNFCGRGYICGKCASTFCLLHQHYITHAYGLEAISMYLAMFHVDRP